MGRVRDTKGLGNAIFSCCLACGASAAVLVDGQKYNTQKNLVSRDTKRGEGKNKGGRKIRRRFPWLPAQKKITWGRGGGGGAGSGGSDAFFPPRSPDDGRVAEAKRDA